MNEREPHEIWIACLAVLKDLVAQSIYKTYLEPCDVVSYDGRELKIFVPSDYYRQYIEEKLILALRRALNHVLGKQVPISYLVAVKRGATEAESTSVQYPASPQYPRRNQNVMLGPSSAEAKREQRGIVRNVTVDPQLHPDFCYEHFAMGEGNRVAYQACKQTLQDFSSQRMKVPLFFFGDPGVGKTHLMQSMGLEFRKLFPNYVVQYITANQFTKLFTEVCTRKKKGEKEAIDEFEAYYESINLLLVDDLQELSVRYYTQDFLLNILERMQRNNSQIVFASAQAPAMLSGFRESLLSRLKSGTVIGIQPLDLSKRVEILRQRAQRDGIDNIPPQVFEYMATYVPSNIRELIGVYTSLVANATFAQRAITIALTQEVMKNTVGERTIAPLTIEEIKQVVSKYFHLRADELCETTRRANIVEPRQIAMFLAKEYTQTPLAAIGQQLGRKSHSTVLHATKAVKDRIDCSKEFREDIENIKRELRITE